ncbi:MAG: DNA translocase FtsK [Marinilabiliales bacterium]
MHAKKKKNKENNFFNKNFGFLKSERFKYSIGLLLLISALFFLLSFTSYLFTWQEDQSKLSIQSAELYESSDIYVDNWGGKLGAVISNLFIHDWFGIASFSVIFLLILYGFALLNIKFLPVIKTTKITIILTVWLSFTLGYLFGTDFFYLGGSHGYFLSKWFTSFAGNVGTIGLIVLFMFVFILFTIPGFLSFLQKLFKLSDKDNSISEDKNLTENLELKLNEENDDNLENEDIKIDDNKDEVEFEFNNLDIEQNKNNESRDNNSIDSDSDKSDIEMSVEIASGTETDDDGEIELKVDTEYEPTKTLSMYKYPPIDLLTEHQADNNEVTEEEIKSNKDKIVETLLNYGIKISKIKATVGPTVTLYEIVPAPGIRISKIKNLEDDIALSLSALGIRIIAPIPGKGTIGIEVPNKNPEIVSMRSVIASRKFQESDYELPVVIGKTISNEVYTFDLVKMPHLLVAGATGQGKSVGLNAIITSLLYKKHPSQLKFVMIDPKKVELSLYSKIEKHFLAKLPDEEKAIITDVSKVVPTLNSLTKLMDSRYNLLEKARLKNIKEYNKKFILRQLNPEKGHDYMPYIVVVVDEFADLIMTAGKEVEAPIARIAQLARAVGIHLIIATQRPSTNIITGMIKANFPARIAFKVVSMIDSRTILDTPGANQLIGRGDMLLSLGNDLIRIQCAFLDTPEVDEICEYISQQQAPIHAYELPEPDSDSSSPADVDLDKRDPLFDEAARLIVANQQGSTSLIQRKFSIGYNRAGRIIDQLEAAGIVGPYEGSKARKVMFSDLYALEQFLNNLNNS